MEESESQQSSINKRTILIGCVIALVATSFGFAVRGQLLGTWKELYGLSNEQQGYIQGAGLFPFAITIILFSLIVDRIGYGVSMAIAFGLHIASAIITLCAPLAGTPDAKFVVIYVGTFVFALGNGAVEAVINPVVASMYKENKTKYLSILHSGWPLGLALGGVFGVSLLRFGDQIEAALPGHLWWWRIALILLPMLLYGFLLFGEKFPVHERVEAGVSFREMLEQFGWGGGFITIFLLVAGFNQILTVVGLPAASYWAWLGIAALLTLPFALWIRKFGRPLFVLLLLIMCLVATTELGGDSWMQNIFRSIIEGSYSGATGGIVAGLLFAWMALIMFGLRFYIGPFVEKFSPLGVLAITSFIACVGLLGLSVVTSIGMIFVVATVYAVGKSYFWPAMLGIVGEQFPKGGALTLNAIAGIGMIFVGTLGNPSIGTVQDQEVSSSLQAQLSSETLNQVTTREEGVWGTYRMINQEKVDKLPDDKREQVNQIARNGKQASFAWLAILPAIMLLCYIALILYFRSRGGYESVQLGEDAAHADE